MRRGCYDDMIYAGKDNTTRRNSLVWCGWNEVVLEPMDIVVHMHMHISVKGLENNGWAV